MFMESFWIGRMILGSERGSECHNLVLLFRFLLVSFTLYDLPTVFCRLLELFIPYSKQRKERAYTISGFCYIDARDCAQAFRLAIEKKDLTGSHVFNIANADIAYEKQTTKELADLVFPGVPFTPETDDPREGLISIKKAREVLGFDPKYGWLGEVTRLRKEGKI